LRDIYELSPPKLDGLNWNRPGWLARDEHCSFFVRNVSDEDKRFMILATDLHRDIFDSRFDPRLPTTTIDQGPMLKNDFNYNDAQAE